MNRFTRSLLFVTTLFVAVIVTATLLAGCGSGEQTESQTTTAITNKTVATAPTATSAPPPGGIQLPSALQSSTGTPSPAEMPPLINLQAQVPYPVIVPTYLPSGYSLDADLIGQGGKTARDPVGYYSFRFADPSNSNRSYTFNQSRSNSKPLSGYYLTEEEINGVNYMIYWHKTRDYLPEGDPVRTYAVGDAETFVVVWKSQYNDPVTGPQELWYNMQSGTWTTTWGQVRSVLESLKPLSAVGG